MKALWPAKSFIDMVLSGELDASDLTFFLLAIEDTPIWERKDYFACIGIREHEREQFTFCESVGQEMDFVKAIIESRKKERHG